MANQKNRGPGGMIPVPKDFRKQLIAACAARGAKAEIAKTTGVSATAVGGLASGKTSYIRKAMLDKLQRYLGNEASGREQAMPLRLKKKPNPLATSTDANGEARELAPNTVNEICGTFSMSWRDKLLARCFTENRTPQQVLQTILEEAL